MAVTCVQINDGTVNVSYLIPPPVPGWTDAQLMEWKGTKHEEAGWAVAWAGNRRSFDATKTYPAVVDPKAIRVKQRTFRRA